MLSVMSIIYCQTLSVISSGFKVWCSTHASFFRCLFAPLFALQVHTRYVVTILGYILPDRLGMMLFKTGFELVTEE